MKKLCIMIIAVVLTANISPVTAAAKKRPTIRPTMIYTLAGCERCSELKSCLRKRGVSVKTAYTSQRYFNYYPTVIYSNKTTDNGERIFDRRCSMPDSIQLVETE